MSVRSKYREKVLAEKVAEPNIPEIKINGERPDHVTGISAEIPHTDKPDEASLRLQKQLDDIKKSEEIQRQRQTVAVQPTPDQALQFWKNNGLDEAGERFLLTHPQHILGLTNFAGQRASQQGHQLGSVEHTEVAKQVFHDSLARLEAAQAQPAAAQPSPSSTNQTTMERTRPLLPLPEPRERSSIYSAPVSRDGAGSGYREPSPSQVKLGADELEIAKASGISPVEYARNKLRMLREQKTGERQR